MTRFGAVHSGDEPTMDEEREEGTGRQGPWARDDDDRADKQQGDPQALDVEDDPRGGIQSEDYRHADPREIVVEGSTAMSGPAGAPQEELSVEERRELTEKFRGELRGDEPQPGR
jgi:hypothetical protein